MLCLWIFNNNKKYTVQQNCNFFSQKVAILITMRKRKPDGNIQVSTSSGLHHSCLISKPVQQKKKKRTTFAVLFFTIDGKLVGYRYTKTRWYDTNKTWCWQQRANWNHVWQCLVTDELFLQGDIDVSLLHVRFGNCLLPISVIFPSVQCTHTLYRLSLGTLMISIQTL